MSEHIITAVTNKRTYHSKNLAGMRFGRWQVISFIERKGTRRMWLCRCDCGTERLVGDGVLQNGHSQSCGCLWKEHLKVANSKPKGFASSQRVLGTYRKNAETRGLAWNLTDEEFFSIVVRACHYCGEAASNVFFSKSNNGNFTWNGVDRKDNSKGYSLDNVVPCCTYCNFVKGGSSYIEFCSWLDKVAKLRSGGCGQ